MSKLKLLVDSYDQPQADDARGDRHLKEITKGQLFEPVSKAEEERLKEIGAALDPKEAAEKAAADAKAEADQLRARAEALEAQADAVETPSDEDADLSSLTVPEIDKRLDERDLPKTGNKDEKLARLSEALAQE